MTLERKKLRQVYQGMIGRCYRPKCSHYEMYGGRGIAVCERWRNSVENFLSDMEPSYRIGLTIERKDNDGDYSPDNCEWIPLKDQFRNRRSNLVFTYKGESKCLQHWCEASGLSRGAIHRRLAKGWSMEMVLETPVERNKSHKGPKK